MLPEMSSPQDSQMMLHDDCESLPQGSSFLVSFVYQIFEPGYHNFHLAARMHHENRSYTACGDRNTVDDEGREALHKEHDLVCRTEMRVQDLDVEGIG